MGSVRYVQSRAEREEILETRRLLASIALVLGAERMLPGNVIPEASRSLVLSVQGFLERKYGKDFTAWCKNAIDTGLEAIVKAKMVPGDLVVSGPEVSGGQGLSAKSDGLPDAEIGEVGHG